MHFDIFYAIQLYLILLYFKYYFIKEKSEMTC